MNNESQDNKEYEKEEADTTGLPSMFKTWNQFYGFVLFFLAFQIALYKLFSVYFSN